MVHATGYELHSKNRPFPPVARVDDNRIDVIEPAGRFAKWACGQTESVTQTTLSIYQHDLQITPMTSSVEALRSDTATKLRMNMTAKTYRYLDEEEIAEEAAKSAKRGQRR